MCWAWWGCRVTLTGRTDMIRWLALAGFAVASALATWMNTASLAALLAVGVLEAFRARARPGRVAGGRGPRGGRSDRMCCCGGATPRTASSGSAGPSSRRSASTGSRVLANAGPVLASLRHEGGLWPFLVGAAAIAAPRRTRGERFDGIALLLFGLSVLLRAFCSCATSGPTSSRASCHLSLPTFWRSLPRCTDSCSSPARWPDDFVGWCACLPPALLGPAWSPAPRLRDPLAHARAHAARLAAAGPRSSSPITSTSTSRRRSGPRGAWCRSGPRETSTGSGRPRRAAPGHDGARAVRARPPGRDARAARSAPRRVEAPPIPGRPVPGAGTRWSGRRHRAGSLARGRRRSAGCIPTQTSPLHSSRSSDEEAVAERAHAPVWKSRSAGSSRAGIHQSWPTKLMVAMGR